MYKIAPVQKVLRDEIKLPSRMYKMPFLYDEFGVKKSDAAQADPIVLKTSTPVTNGGSDESKLQAILDRQNKLLDGLMKLEIRLKVSEIAGNETPEERTLRMLIARQQTILLKLAKVESDVHNLIGYVADGIDAIQVNAAQESAKPTARSEPSFKGCDIAIHVDASGPSAELKKLLASSRTDKTKNVLVSTHYHSSVLGSKVAPLFDEPSSSSLSRTAYDHTVTLIVKSVVPNGPSVIINPTNPEFNINGEQKVLDYLRTKLSVKKA